MAQLSLDLTSSPSLLLWSLSNCAVIHLRYTTYKHCLKPALQFYNFLIFFNFPSGSCTPYSWFISFEGGEPPARLGNPQTPREREEQL